MTGMNLSTVMLIGGKNCHKRIDVMCFRLYGMKYLVEKSYLGIQPCVARTWKAKLRFVAIFHENDRIMEEYINGF